MTINNSAMNDHKQQPLSAAPGVLVLVRHTESEWNVAGKWTGRIDVHLTDKGQREAAMIGEMLHDIDLHHSYTSEQIRTVETLVGLLNAGKKQGVSHERSESLNERDYGEYTGLNKWEVLEQVGDETFSGIRRGWDHPIPGGETLQNVHDRAVPFYLQYILPRLMSGQNVLVVSHGNTIRSLIKYLENISDTEIADVEMGFGQILIYRVDTKGRHHSKETRQIDTTPPKA